MRRSTRFRFPGRDQCCCVEAGDARQHHRRPLSTTLKAAPGAAKRRPGIKRMVTRKGDTNRPTRPTPKAHHSPITPSQIPETIPPRAFRTRRSTPIDANAAATLLMYCRQTKRLDGVYKDRETQLRCEGQERLRPAQILRSTSNFTDPLRSAVPTKCGDEMKPSAPKVMPSSVRVDPASGT